MWLYGYKSAHGEEPILFDDGDAPAGDPGVWRRVARVKDLDEVYTLLAQDGWRSKTAAR